jgi:hypothetical protein
VTALDPFVIRPDVDLHRGAPDLGQVQLACDTSYGQADAAEFDRTLRAFASQRADLRDMGEFSRTNSRIPGFDSGTLG